MGEIVSKSVRFTCRGQDFPSLWLWNPRQPDRLIVVFLDVRAGASRADR